MYKDILVDSHAHLHEFVSISDFLSHAYLNFRKYGEISGSIRFVGLLCLADFSAADGWKRLEVAVSSQSIKGWKLTQIDNVTIVAESDNKEKLYLIAGKQVVSSEGLEILALGVKTSLQSNQPLNQLIAVIGELGGLAIVPWGSGKWWGRRGRLIREMIRSCKTICYGDNGGRPWFWKPVLLKLATEKGLPVVPGSDPLPIKIDCLRSGSYGLKIKKTMVEQVSVEWLFKVFNTAGCTMNRFGNNMNFLQYLYRQLLLRIK